MQQTLTHHRVDAITFPRILVALLGSKLGEHFKRIIFVFSVYAVVAKSTNVNKQNIRDINDELKLARNADVCVSSAMIHAKIWNQSTGSKTYRSLPVLHASISPSDRDTVVNYYLDNCPDWLRYGESNACDMRRDLRRLFRTLTKSN